MIQLKIHGQSMTMLTMHQKLKKRTRKAGALKRSLPLLLFVRPTQSIMYIPFQVNRFQKCILLIV